MIRSYIDNDYDNLKALYLQSDLYGGVFDEARDGRERLASKIAQDPEAILVYEQDRKLVGRISLIEDGRVAWLYRFAVVDFDEHVSKQLYDAAIDVLKARGHSEVLVYSSPTSTELDARYSALGMNRGGDYTAYWSKI